jgi:hypothetical protein
LISTGARFQRGLDFNGGSISTGARFQRGLDTDGIDTDGIDTAAHLELPRHRKNAAKSRLAPPGPVAMMPPRLHFHFFSCPEAIVVFHRSPEPPSFRSAIFATLRRAAPWTVLALVTGCQSDGEMVDSGRGRAGLLAPTSVQEYARQKGISNDQARHELQQKVNDGDAADAVKNIDEAGTSAP